MTNRVHIDAPAGVVEIEGEKDFVEGLLVKLFPLLEEAGFGSRPPQRNQASENKPHPNETVDDDTEESSDDVGKPKIKRKRSAAPPKGHSCADRILTLKEEGFFKEKRGIGDIVTGLAGKGFTHKSNQVSAALESLFKRGFVQRTKDGSGPFQYFWDRD